MTVINALINAWADYGPGLIDSLINQFVATGFRCFFKCWRQWSRTDAIGQHSTSNAPPPPKRLR
ncbi:MAG: hypothetical protein WC597_17000 [Brevundimonas sp.]